MITTLAGPLKKRDDAFCGLCFHMNDIAGCLYDALNCLSRFFNEREVKGKNIPLWKRVFWLYERKVTG